MELVFRSCYLGVGFSGRTIIIKTAGAQYRLIYAGVVELVDSMDLGSIANRCAGSSPAARTTKVLLCPHNSTFVLMPYFYYLRC